MRNKPPQQNRSRTAALIDITQQARGSPINSTKFNNFNKLDSKQFVFD